MSTSGSLEARCKVCGCVFSWSMGNLPFIDAEIVGTCSECFDKIDHNVFHENIINENSCPVIVARIVFDKGTHHFESVDGKFLKKSQVARLMYWGKQPVELVKKHKRKSRLCVVGVKK